MKDNQFMPYFVIIGVVAIVALVSLVLFSSGGIVGAPVYQEKLDEFQGGCTDDDPANDRSIPGSVKKGVSEYIDHCRENKLFQYECGTSSNPRFTRPYECPNGCSNGVCLGE